MGMLKSKPLKITCVVYAAFPFSLSSTYPVSGGDREMLASYFQP